MDSPLLLLPLDQETENNNNLCLFNVQNKNTFTPNALQNLQDYHCIGSSHGWLAFLDEKSDPFLLNPFSNIRIRLPGKQTLPNIHHLEEKANGTFKIQYKQGHSTCYSSKNRGQLLFSKAVLSSNPSCNDKYAVVIMYKEQYGKTKLAYSRHGDEVWSDLQGTTAATYCDIVCSNADTLLALGPGPSVEVWDLNESIPRRRTIIGDSCPRRLVEANETFPSDLYSSQWYLAMSSSSGDIYFVVRYIGEYMKYDGEVVCEGDTLTDDAAEPLVCPYKTVKFHVYKLVDLDQNIWTEVESLNEVSLFLGGNHSMVLPIDKYQEGLKGNSIYFTDDYWDRVDEDYSYGGHDIGIFNLEDGKIQPLILDIDHQKIVPPPFWISYPSNM